MNTQFGQYRIIRPLGTGANAEVFLAEDCNTGISYAIKIFEDGKDHTEERNLLKRLNHKGIPKLKDCFPIQNGYCIVMDYAQGNTLTEIIETDIKSAGKSTGSEEETASIREKAASIREKAGSIREMTVDREVRTVEAKEKIAGQLADILLYLHTLPIPVIHADLKPGNIIVTDSGEVRLLDFGSAFLLSDDLREFHGTLGYAAPEVSYGKCDQRSDVYSFGKILIYLMTGKSPAFLGEKPDKGLLVRMGMKKKDATLALKCIEENPSKRFPSAKELKQAMIKNRRNYLFMEEIRKGADIIESVIFEVGGGLLAIYGLYAHFLKGDGPGKLFLLGGCILLVLKLCIDSGRRKSWEGEFTVLYSLFLSDSE